MSILNNFKYKDKVEVTQGFYQGCVGRAIKENADIPGILTYDVLLNDDNIITVSVFDLKKV